MNCCHFEIFLKYAKRRFCDKIKVISLLQRSILLYAGQTCMKGIISMNLHFEESLGDRYKSKSQKVRVMSEIWIEKNMFCPCCGNVSLVKLKNNQPAADFRCDNCGEVFELKSKKGKTGKKINDGAYSTMIKRINSITNPNFLVLNYSSGLTVTDLLIIPKFFIIPQIIERRNPLASTVQRAGWTGCNILYHNIPPQGKIYIIKNEIIRRKDEILENYVLIKNLETNNINSRSWLFDVLNCVNQINKIEFCLKDVYAYIDVLKDRHTNNNNIEAKIRQQLQVLRDKGFIEFLDRGHYKKCL